MPSNKKSSKEISLLYYCLILLIGLGAILVGNVLYETSKLWATFIIEIGIAFIISLIVIFTIERFQRNHQNEFLEEITDQTNENVFRAIYKRFIPEAVFKEIEDSLLSAHVFRTKHEIQYSIKKFPNREHQHHVLCEAVSSYTLKNMTGSVVKQHIVMQLERPVKPELDEFCKVTAVRIGKKKLDEATIKNQTKTLYDRFNFSQEVEIPPNGSVEIQCESTLVKYKLDNESWVLKHPSDGVSLTLEVIDPELKLDLYASARHSKDLELRLDKDTRKKWELNHGTFPHQSVVMWWKEKEHG